MKKIGNLLQGSVKRARIGSHLLSSRAVEAANMWLREALPENRTHDAKALSFRKGNLVIECKNSSAASFVNEHAHRCRDHVTKVVPECDIEKILTRLVAQIQSHEF